MILVAIVATANHFLLDAVAGGLVCAAAWRGNAVLRNLCALGDWVLSCLRMHRPEVWIVSYAEDGGEKCEWVQGVVTR